MSYYLIIFILLFVYKCNCTLPQLFSEGGPCELSDGTRGVCKLSGKCPYVKRLVDKYKGLQVCGYMILFPIVCCASPSGQKSKDFCDKHYRNSSVKFIARGNKALSKEYPHMAALGYGSKFEIQYRCGGSLISETFILTAAHCLATHDLGSVRWVRLGDLNIANDFDDASPQNFRVKNKFRHPHYRAFSDYNDVALIELDRPIKITEYVRPACLQTEKKLPMENPIAIGWGKTSYDGEISSDLLEVTLNYVAFDKCKEYFRVSRNLDRGISDESQICAGDANPTEGKLRKDTCQGDSGGPLQARLNGMWDGYAIVGITSAGSLCGFVPGIYTRVSYYVPWIESIVWPN